ncbi:uncharacterized protein LOC143021859 [Oratosquilla oratoria]|uniref:uncharacterized protein LOC143021859 n=1 Tax=Oratosquilla oratoria TaxID=337810 RepID=UPI003F767ACC
MVDDTTIEWQDRRQTTRCTAGYGPLFEKASEVATRLLRKHGVEVEHKPRNTLYRTLAKVEDTESQADRIGVVYDVRCKNCETYYVGKTGKRLATRLQVHQRAVGKRDMSSAILRHCEYTSHEMDWHNTEVKYRGNEKSVRLFLEV